ncbi:hypothetical protein Tco_1474760 [Tanacetum coccineum]
MASLAPQDRWSKDKHIELVNIIGNPGAIILTMAMAKELSATSAHECLFVDFLSEEEPKKVSKALKHPGWLDAIQEELNQFAINKVWTLVSAPYGKTIIGYKRCKMDVTSAFLNGKLKEEIYVKQPLVKTPMVPSNNLGHDLNGKSMNETQYRGFNLKGYSDSDYVGCNMDRKSTPGACQLVVGKLMCWSAKKQQSVAMSSVEAEYVAAAVTSFMRKYYFIRDHILKGDIELHFIPTQYQLVEIFTKPLDKPTFKRLIVELGMLNIDDIKP